jgi:alkaline phosphatase D
VGAGLTQQQAQEKAGTWVKGNVSLFYVNQVLAALGQSRLPATGTSRGIAYVHMGKSSLFTIQGSRYIVVKPIFDLYAGFKYATTAGASQNVLGTEQQAWLQETTRTATNTWKVIVSSVSFTSMVFNLSNKADIPDPNLRQTFYFNADQWDGFPTKKQELLGFMRQNVPNSLVISGDIHASFASVESGVPTLTAPGISSGSIKELAGLAVIGAGYATGSPVYKYVVAELEKSMSEPEANPGMRFVDGDKHGFVVLEVKANEAIATFHLIGSAEIAKDYSLRAPEELNSKFTSKRLRIQGGNITDA